MKKILLLSLLFLNVSTLAKEFQGCGLYRFNGIRKIDPKAKFESLYIVHEGTRSQMSFEFAREEDVLKLTGLIDIATTFEAKILQKMDGTRGVIVELTQISRRFPNPLSSKNVGLTKLSSLDCL